MVPQRCGTFSPFIFVLTGLFLRLWPPSASLSCQFPWPMAALRVCIWVQFVQLQSVTEALFKKKRVMISVSSLNPPSCKQFHSHRGSWTAGGGFLSQSPAEQRAGCPFCILCTSTAWGWGRALDQGPRCRAFLPRSETLALLPTGTFRVNVGQREHQQSIRDQERSTFGLFVSLVCELATLSQ